MRLKKLTASFYNRRGLYHFALFLIVFIPKKTFSIPRSVVNYFLSHYYYNSSRIVRLNDIRKSVYYLAARKTRFPHPIGIVIGNGVSLGENCVIYQHVTLGGKTISGGNGNEYPVIGNNVIIYANAIIIGDIKIGDNVVVGAGAIVTKDIANNSLVVGHSLIK
jgi:serine O-acetyltransferase